MLTLIAILNMAGPTKGHEIFNYIPVLGTTHSPGLDVVDVNRLGTTDLTRIEVGPSEIVDVYLCVFFHFLEIAMARICFRDLGLPLAPLAFPVFLLSAMSSRMLAETLPFFSGILFYFGLLL